MRLEIVNDPDYEYGRHYDDFGFKRFVSEFAIYKIIWRALNPELNHSRNIRDVGKWRELDPMLNRLRTRQHYQTWKRRMTLRTTIERSEKERGCGPFRFELDNP